MIEVEGIIVSEMDYKDTSKIIGIMTKTHGLISCIARGAKRIKSPLRSTTGKLTYGKFQILYKEDKLSTLIEVDVINIFKKIKTDIICISYASFLVDLAGQVMKQNNNPEIYDLLISGLLKIDDGFDPAVITNIIELKYLDYLGVMPIIDSCAVCGRTNNIATISVRKGGYLCNYCRNDETLVDEKAIKLLRMFYYVDISKITKLDISQTVKNEIDKFLDEYYDDYTGLYLKSKKFLKDLNKIV